MKHTHSPLSDKLQAFVPDDEGEGVPSQPTGVFSAPVSRFETPAVLALHGAKNELGRCTRAMPTKPSSPLRTFPIAHAP
jgi:hypothetical protein